MTGAKNRRLQAATRAISSQPQAVDDAYATFLTNGTLPNHDPLARRVLWRALNARKPVPELEAERRALGLNQPFGTTREMLFREAMCTVGPIRDLARYLLRCVVEAGYDPTDAEVIGPELEPADFGSVAMQLLGWPRDYVRPRYRDQLERVVRQQATVRASRPFHNEEWDRGAGAALSSFLTRGVVPSDPRYSLFVLSTGEQVALHAHYFDRGGEDLPAAYEAVANASGPEREAALERLGALQAAATEARSA